jgi:hypothetical protein
MTQETDKQIMHRLSAELGWEVTRSMVRHWRKKKLDLADPVKLTHQLRMLQKSRPGFTSTSRSTDKVPTTPAADMRIFSPDEISDEIHKLENALINALDYEAARIISTKLSGLRAAAKLRAEMDLFVTRASVQKDMVLVEKTFRAVLEKMATELPQQIIGADYPSAAKRCQDYAHQILLEVSSAETYAGAT